MSNKIIIKGLFPADEPATIRNIVKHCREQDKMKAGLGKEIMTDYCNLNAEVLTETHRRNLN